MPILPMPIRHTKHMNPLSLTHIRLYYIHVLIDFVQIRRSESLFCGVCVLFY